jgi:DNA polymerase-3 subunit alpha
MSFVHLNVRSHFSIGRSILRIEDLVERAATLGMPAVALTDDNLSGAVRFVKACAKHGIKPILGARLRVGAAPPPGLDDRIIVLARNAEGYANLRTLVTRAHLDPPESERPRLHPGLLARHTAGLIALVGGSGGRLAELLADGDLEGARAPILEWARLFGDGDLYLELGAGEGPGRRQINQGLIALSAKTGLPLVATAPVRYLDPEDTAAHKVQADIMARSQETAARIPGDDGEALHLATPAWMAARFAEHPEALANALKIAERIDDGLLQPATRPILPEVPLPEGRTASEHLGELARKGLADRLMRMRLDGKAPDESAYRDRLAHELAIVTDLGFERYFLTWQDIISWARQREVPVGPGRGSAAGSLVLFALGVTGIDPVAHGLIFERFLNPKRALWPDVDVDFCMDWLDVMRDRLQLRFGRDRVAQIAVFTRWRGRGLIRQVAEALALEDRAHDLHQAIPVVPVPDLERLRDEYPDIDRMILADERLRELWDIAVRLEGTPCDVGRHVAGMVIADRPVEQVAPLFLPAEGLPATQFDRRDAEAVGLVTFDLLGLMALTRIHEAEKAIRKHLDPSFRIERIPTDDSATFGMISRGETDGVFQFETPGMREMARRMQPASIADLAAIIAIFRPGPLLEQMDVTYQAVRSGRRRPVVLHPALAPILAETAGQPLYQEQLMHIAHDLGGLDMADADLMRRAMGKRDPKAIAPFRAAFFQGAKARGIEPQAAGEILHWMERLAPYAFSKAHVIAYATIAYRMAYLKTHHPEACDWEDDDEDSDAP